MSQILMNMTTLVGGVFGLLIGVAVFFFVFLILGLPYVLMTRHPEEHFRDPQVESYGDSRTPRLDQRV